MDEGWSTPLRRLQTTLRYLLGLAVITHRFIALRNIKTEQPSQVAHHDLRAIFAY